MATNPYFNHHHYAESQNLVEDLVIEFIQSMGVDVRYVPRETVKEDRLFGEDVLSRFDESYEIEMYWDTSNEWEGQGRFFSKFGLQDARQIEFIVSRKRFNHEIAQHRDDIHKPRIGDLLFLNDTYETAPFNIVWVEEYSLQQRNLNKPYTWKITAELMTYSHEDIQTGVEELDGVAIDFDNMDSILNQTQTDNKTIDELFDDIKDPSKDSPFGNF